MFWTECCLAGPAWCWSHSLDVPGEDEMIDFPVIIKLERQIKSSVCGVSIYIMLL